MQQMHKYTIYVLVNIAKYHEPKEDWEVDHSFDPSILEMGR
jgi:hypothetical protein